MSGVSFSHQFTQRWIQSPDLVRAAIVQELKDIMTLLQTDISVEAFEFTQPDLDGYLDELYQQDEAEQLRKAEQSQAEEEQQRLKEEILANQRQNLERLEQEQQQRQLTEAAELADVQRLVSDQADIEQAAQTEHHSYQHHSSNQHESAQLSNEDVNIENSADTNVNDATEATAQPVDQIADSECPDTVINEHPTAKLTIHQSAASENPVYNEGELPAVDHIDASPSSQQAALETHLEDSAELSEPTTISHEQEALIQELEMRIDDYLSEQMTLMSEGLKAWVREEVRRQLQANNR